MMSLAPWRASAAVSTPLLGVDVLQRGLLHVHSGAEGEGQRGQGLQPLFPGDGGPGAPLLLVGAVQVLHLRQGGGGVNGGGKLAGELALVLNGGLYFPLPGLQAAQVLQAVGQLAQQLVVHGAVELLAVAGDKGDGGPLVDQPDHVVHMLLGAAQLPGQGLNHRVHSFISSANSFNRQFTAESGKSPVGFLEETVV